MGRPKLLKRKAQKHWCLAYAHLLPPLKAALAPPGLDLSDGQTIDILMATMHELLVEKQGIICDPDKMLAVLNSHFKKTFSEFLVETLTGFGHFNVSTKWREDGSVTVTCDGGTAIVPAQVFAGERLDRDAILRDLKTEGRAT